MKLKLICLATYLIHLGISHVILPWIGVANLFPFYDWNLFSYNPTYQPTPIIKVLEVNGRPLEGPSWINHNGYISRSKMYWVIPEQLNILVKHINDLGEDHELTLKVRRELEKNMFFREERVKYELIMADIHIRESLFLENINRTLASWIFEYKRSTR